MYKDSLPLTDWEMPLVLFQAQNASPRKPAGSLLEDINATVSKMEKIKPEGTRTRDASGGLVRPKNTQCPICEKVRPFTLIILQQMI